MVIMISKWAERMSVGDISHSGDAGVIWYKQ
jgi:hypothetical protein